MNSESDLESEYISTTESLSEGECEVYKDLGNVLKPVENVELYTPLTVEKTDHISWLNRQLEEIIISLDESIDFVNVRDDFSLRAQTVMLEIPMNSTMNRRRSAVFLREQELL